MSAVTVIAGGGTANAVDVRWVGEADTRKWSTSATAEAYGADASSRTWSAKAVSTISVGGTPYGGSYAVVPTEEGQTLQTRGKTLSENITVGGIPRSYGLITWDGSTLTVS